MARRKRLETTQWVVLASVNDGTEARFGPPQGAEVGRGSRVDDYILTGFWVRLAAPKSLTKWGV